MSDRIPAPNSDDRHIFLSYSRKDAAEWVDDLERHFHDRGYRTWRDMTNIIPGVPFGETLKKAIDRSFVVVAIITPSCSLDAEVRWWVKCEWYYAISRGLTILPVLAPNVSESGIPFEFCAIPRFAMTGSSAALLERLVPSIDFAKTIYEELSIGR